MGACGVLAAAYVGVRYALDQRRLVPAVITGRAVGALDEALTAAHPGRAAPRPHQMCPQITASGMGALHAQLRSLLLLIVLGGFRNGAIAPPTPSTCISSPARTAGSSGVGTWTFPQRRRLFRRSPDEATAKTFGNEFEAAFVSYLGRITSQETKRTPTFTSLVSAHLAGLAILRYVLAVEPLASLEVEELMERLVPANEVHFAADPGLAAPSPGPLAARERSKRERTRSDVGFRLQGGSTVGVGSGDAPRPALSRRPASAGGRPCSRLLLMQSQGVPGGRSDREPGQPSPGR